MNAATGSSNSTYRACATSATETPARFTNYVSLMRGRAERSPDQLAYVHLDRGDTPNEQFTYQTLDRDARRLAVILQSMGATNQRVLLLLASDLHYVVSFFACLYAGAVAVTLDSSTKPKHLARLQTIVRDAEPAVVLATATTRRAVMSQPGADAIFGAAAWLDVDDLPAADPDDWRPGIVRGDTLAFLQYTSGSIADPKVVMITHENLLFQGAYLERLLGFTPEDVTVTWLPHFHDMGLILGVLQASYTGFPCYLMTPTSFIKRPMCWLEAISRFGGTFSPAPNFAYDLCVQSFDPASSGPLDLSSWKVALNGAEPVRKSTLDRFCATFGSFGFDPAAFCVGYGMAEATLAISTTTRALAPRSVRARPESLLDHRVIVAGDGEDSREIVSCGRTELGSEAIVVSPDELAPLPNNVIGEILVGGGSRASGYWRRPDQSRATFEVFLADGRGPYLRTGDLGFVDDAGELYVAGRDKDLLIINGKNHWPQDLEISAEACHPAVRPHFVAAFCVEIEGREQAVLVAELQIEADEAELRQVAATIRTTIAREHDLRLAQIVFLDRGQFPKTTSGKLQRQQCRALHQRDQWRVLARYA